MAGCFHLLAHRRDSFESPPAHAGAAHLPAAVSTMILVIACSFGRLLARQHHRLDARAGLGVALDETPRRQCDATGSGLLGSICEVMIWSTKVWNSGRQPGSVVGSLRSSIPSGEAPA